MNWLHFLLWVAGIYALYYLAVILFDLMGGRGTSQSLSPELTFSEATPPVALKHESHAENVEGKKPAGPKSAQKKQKPDVIASGGVSLKDLFTLARQEAIIYTNSVGY